MHRKDNKPRPPSALEDRPETPEEVTSPSARVHESDAMAPPSAPEDPQDDDPSAEEPLEDSVEISLSSVAESEAVLAPPPPLPRNDTPRAPPPPPASLSDPRIGETLVGRYRLDKLIGKGGMGRVYRATQFPLNRPVAVKILNPEFQKKDPQFVRRFFLEAASAARLTHPNTITVFDYGEAESGELFIAMEYLNGRPLSRVIAAEGPFEAERALHVAMQICRALREAHTKGIIHRDLKPGNILLLEEGDDADFVKVLDFGLVKLFHTDGRPASGLGEPLTPEPPEGELTKAGMFLGSPKYMSPEQIQGIPLDPRTDVYSLGVLMYQMVCGKPPFGGGSSVEVIYKHVNEAVPPLATHGVAAAPELEQLILDALAKRRDERFDSMSSFLARMKDVRRLLTGISASLETGVDIRLSDLRGRQHTPSLVQTAQPTRPMVAAQTVSARPQTRPHLPASGEVPFAEAGISGLTDETGSHAMLGKTAPRGSRMPLLAPILAGTALVVVLGLLAYVVVGDRQRFAAPPVDAPPTVEEPVPARGPSTQVRFTSEPSGAEVFEHGVSLGKTPLVLTLPRDVEGMEPHEFLFKLAGRGEKIERVRLDQTQVEVAVRLADDKASPNPRGEDYKENPY